MPDNEKLISYWPCAYAGKWSNQGWLYLSISHLCFHSLILGTETKVMIELKDIEELEKEKSKTGVFSDSIRIITRSSKEVAQTLNISTYFQIYSNATKLSSSYNILQ